MILALAGGVGGAKLARGLTKILSPKELTIVVNTGDDFVHWGLAISPDLDTVMYNLAEINNTQQGWGIRGESWTVMQAMSRFNSENWFQIGDNDLATHLERTRLLKEGFSLSQATQKLYQQMKIKYPILPMSDDKINTLIHTHDAVLSFQTYFVKLKCGPRVKKISYAGAQEAVPCAGFQEALTHPSLSGIIICPSNPWLSIAPILAIPNVVELIKKRNVPIVAVSPIIANRALKGPTGKIMQELGFEVSVQGIIDFYHDFITGIVIDETDRHYQITTIPCRVTNTIMYDMMTSINLAKTVISFLGSV